MTPMAADVSTYRCSRAPGLRIVGLAMLPYAVLWLVAGLLGFPGWAVWLLVLDAVVIGGLGLRLLVFPPKVLTLTGTGFRIHGVRGNTRPAADWTVVDGVTTTQVAGMPTVVIALTDGGTSILPLTLLGAQSMAAQREIHERLNSAYGYRRLDTVADPPA